ncbi:MAG: hypothetical protein KAY32_18380, partial [Candidatus Eisenbacteria sp.]|nr:hypothetical protein [Candidatus Eisenbacteria bacterium]
MAAHDSRLVLPFGFADVPPKLTAERDTLDTPVVWSPDLMMAACPPMVYYGMSAWQVAREVAIALLRQLHLLLFGKDGVGRVGILRHIAGDPDFDSHVYTLDMYCREVPGEKARRQRKAVYIIRDDAGRYRRTMASAAVGPPPCHYHVALRPSQSVT